GNTQVFVVNTGTWAITAVGSPLNFSSVGDHSNALPVGDGQHFVNAFQGDSGQWTTQAFEVNPSTFAVTTIGTGVDLNAHGGNDLNAVNLDGTHFVAFYSLNLGDGYVQLFETDPTTFDMSLVGSALQGYDFANRSYTTSVNMDTHQVLVA